MPPHKWIKIAILGETIVAGTNFPYYSMRKYRYYSLEERNGVRNLDNSQFKHIYVKDICHHKANIEINAERFFKTLPLNVSRGTNDL